MKHIVFILAFCSILLSCANKENLTPTHPLDVSLEKPPAATLFERIDEIGMMPHLYTWQDMDKLYRNEVANSNNHDCKNASIFWLVSSLNLVENADDDVIKYYLQEIRKNDFNTNLELALRILERAENFWNDQTIANYANDLYEKNQAYWADNFPGQTSYLEKNEAAFQDLLVLTNKNR